MNDLDQILRQLWQSEEAIGFAITPARAFILIAQIQLALSHPENTGSSAEIAKEMADNLTEAVCMFVPNARKLIETGWKREYDMTREYFQAEFCDGPLTIEDNGDPNHA